MQRRRTPEARAAERRKDHRQEPGALLPGALGEELFQPGKHRLAIGRRREVRLEPSRSPQAGEQRAQPEGRIGRGAVQIQRLTQPTDRGQFLFQLAPGEGRRQESEGAERRESPPYVRLPGEPPPVARALSPPVERRPRVADGEELPAGGDSRNLELPEDDRLEDSGLYGGAGFGGDEEDRLAQTIRANGFPHRFRREGVEELHVQAASPGKPGNERLRTERGPTHRHHDEALETPGEQFVAKPEVLGEFPGGRQRQVHPAEPIVVASGAGRAEPARGRPVGPGIGDALRQGLQRAHRHVRAAYVPEAPGHGVCRCEIRRNGSGRDRGGS